MKKIITIMLVIAMCLFVLTPYTYSSKLNTKNYQAFGATEANLGQSIIITLHPDNPYMTVNGVSQEIDPGRGTKPVIIPKWSRTVVPIRAIVEALGGTINWIPETRSITILLGDVEVALQIGNSTAVVKSSPVKIDPNNDDVKPIIINDRTMLPLRFVAESLGCDVGWDNDTRTITITLANTHSNQQPVAVFTANPTSGTAPLEVTLDASSSYDPDGSIMSYLWDFKDGNTGNGKTVKHTFNVKGSYNIELTVTDNLGAVSSVTKNIIVSEAINQQPVAVFTANPTSGTAPLEVTLDASSSYDPDGSIMSYLWDFKDGNTGNGKTVKHTFNVKGSYNIELTVTDNLGAVSSVTKNIIVSEAINFCQIGVPYIASDGLTVILNSLTIIEKSGSYQYSISYTLTNNTKDKAIDEGTFKMYYKNESGGLPQYGFFGKLFPGDTKNRTYTFEEVKSKPFSVLEYSSDNFFSPEPLVNSLKWEVHVP